MAYRDYSWYISRLSLALVEKSGSDWVTITTGGLEIQANVIAMPILYTGSVGWEVEHIVEIPIQFHEAIVFKAIAMGYQVPPNMQPDAANYFSVEYEKLLKHGKHYAKTHRVLGGTVTPQDF